MAWKSDIEEQHFLFPPNLIKEPTQGIYVFVLINQWRGRKKIVGVFDVDKSTFTSITTPVSDLEVMCEQMGLIVNNLKVLLKRYLPFLPTIPLYQGMTWDPTWKALPTHPLTQRCWVQRLGKSVKQVRNIRSCLTSLAYELASFDFLLVGPHTYGESWPQGTLWPPTVRYVYDKFNDLLSAWDLDWFTSRVHPHLPSPFDYGIPPVTGRLGQTIEGGGKRRIFAIGNYVNLNQRLLKPVHDWLMQVLRRIPMDGTLHQHKPLDRLVGNQTCYSFDLKSATDRWPVLFLFEVFKVCFGQPFASSVVNSALAFNFFEVPFVKKKDSPVYFRGGQPLGYYSSWPLFTLTHHIIIWWCAEQIYPGQLFDRYAVLGDDVLITDQEVARVYETALGRLGVSNNYQKSLISTTGSAEFAKRFRVRGLSKDLSPISILHLTNSFRTDECPNDLPLQQVNNLSAGWWSRLSPISDF